MASSTGFFKPPILDLGVDRYASFKQWKARWEDYVIVSELGKKDPEYQCAMLRFTFNEETRNIYESLGLSKDDSKNVYKIIEAIEKFAKGIVNETLERHTFNNRIQEDGEKFDEFLTDLKILSRNCNFCENCHNSLIRDRIVAGVNDDTLKQKLLARDSLTLEKAENMCRAHEKAKEGVDQINDQKEKGVNAIQKRFRSSSDTFKAKQNLPTSDQRVCKFCSHRHQWGRDNCPAWGKKCKTCSKLNHFSSSSMCKGQQSMDSVERDEIDMDSLFSGAIEGDVNQNKDFEVTITTKFGKIEAKIDSGADVTAITEDDLKKIGKDRSMLKKTNKRFVGPDSHKIFCIGYTYVSLTWGKNNSKQLVYVCKNLKKALLGKPAIRALHILNVDIPEEVRCEAIEESYTNKFIKEFPKVFNGLGKMKGEPVHIQLKPGTVPFHLSAARHIALPMQDKVREELNRMENLGVIRKVNEPTDWCHPMVIVNKKDGNLRICIDLTKLNLGVKREFYQLESVEETIAKLGGECNYMSKLDCNSGYWQLPLDDESQLLTTFITPFGRYCCTRGPFGLSSMQEIFNKKMDFILEGLKGVAKSTDDLLIYGKTEAEHDERVRQVLHCLEENRVTCNILKCSFSKREQDFVGHHITSQGIQPLRSKVDAIINFPQPTNITELRRFIGMANYLSKFSKDLAAAQEPLRGLLSTKNAWLWTESHTKAFQDVKNVLSNPPVLGHYDMTNQLPSERMEAKKMVSVLS